MKNFKKDILRTADETLYCGGSLEIEGLQGYYEVPIFIGNGIGDVTITLQAGGIPDRFQILWDGDIVADSLFVGNYLGGTSPPNPQDSIFYENAITSTTTLNKFLYDGITFTPNGTLGVSFSSVDIADSTGAVDKLRDDKPLGSTSGDGSVGNQIGVVANYPSSTAKASNGDVKLTFNKNNSLPNTISIVAMGVGSGTGWNILAIECS